MSAKMTVCTKKPSDFCCHYHAALLCWSVGSLEQTQQDVTEQVNYVLISYFHHC